MYINWSVRDKATRRKIDKPQFATREDAEEYIETMGVAFAPLYEAVPNVNDKQVRRMLMEGLVAGEFLDHLRTVGKGDDHGWHVCSQLFDQT